MKKAFIAIVLFTSFGCAPQDEPVDPPTARAPQQNLEPTVEEPEPVDPDLFVGTWSGKYEATGSNSAMSSKEATQMKGMLEAYHATLELREDGTYYLVSMVGAKPIEDEWETDGETIVLASSGADESRFSDSELGTPNSQEYTLTVADDGTLIGPDPIQQGQGAMVFRRQQPLP